MKTVGVYTRVSSEQQDADNQMMAIEHYCQAQGWNITAIYTESETAWLSGHQHELARFLDVLESGKRHFDIFLIFALDRLSREGVVRTFGLVNRIEAHGCQVVSMKEPWAAVDNPMRDVFLAITAWAAKYESDRKSQNTRIGLAKAIAKGVKLGRPKGRKDKPEQAAPTGRLSSEVCRKDGAKVFCRRQIMERQKLSGFAELERATKHLPKIGTIFTTMDLKLVLEKYIINCYNAIKVTNLEVLHASYSYY